MKYLRIQCGVHRLLLDIRCVIEVLDQEHLEFIPSKELHKLAVKDKLLSDCFQQVLWREKQIEFINLSSLMSEFKESTVSKYVVVGDLQADARSDVVRSLMLGVGDLDKIIDIEEVDETDLHFEQRILNLLINRSAFDAELGFVQLCLNLPLNVTTLLKAFQDEVSLSVK